MEEKSSRTFSDYDIMEMNSAIDRFNEKISVADCLFGVGMLCLFLCCWPYYWLENKLQGGCHDR